MDANDDSLFYRLIAKIMHHEGLTAEDMQVIEHSEQLSLEKRELLKDLIEGESGQSEAVDMPPMPQEEIWAAIRRRAAEQEVIAADDVASGTAAVVGGTMVEPPVPTTAKEIDHLPLSHFLSPWRVAATVAALAIGTYFLAPFFSGKTPPVVATGSHIPAAASPAMESTLPAGNKVLFTGADKKVVDVDTIVSGGTIGQTALTQTKAVNKNAMAIEVVAKEVVATEAYYLANGVQMQVVQVGAMREPYQLLLPDSTVVWLAAGARFEYPVHLREKGSFVSLEGEALFAVSRNKNEAFAVMTPTGVLVQVLGTDFNVMAKKGESRIALLSGKLKVSRGDQQYPIKVNEELVEQLGIVKTYPLDSTKRNQLLKPARFFVFDGLTFREALEQVARLYGYSISNPDKLDADALVAKKISRTQSAEKVLAAMQDIENNKVRLTLEGTVIKVSK